MRSILIALLIMFATQSPAQTSSPSINVWAMCGPSKGEAYFFKDTLWNPQGAAWMNDGISNGQITLVHDGTNIDILFGDVARATGYREDGAEVTLLYFGEKYMRIGAFHDNFAEIYNFDRENSGVAWSSNKSGPLGGKVAVYTSKCQFVK